MYYKALKVYILLCVDMGQFDATKGKQALEIRSSLSERRALTDPILPGNGADMAHTLSRHWAKAHGEFKMFETLKLICPHLFSTELKSKYI